jgi:uncharacterized protein
MPQTLPLFPLGSVLYPGLLLPLHVFEDRYRQLVHDLTEGREPRRFGVIAIREGRETGADGVLALHEIGCTAALRRVSERDDGRFDLITVGTDRFRLIALDRSRPYLQGEVEFLSEDTGDETAAAALVPAVQRAFGAYIEALNARGAARVSVPELPSEPIPLSYLVAASVIADLRDRQLLLALPDAARRLNAERAMLSRETSILRSLTSTPAPEFRYVPYSPN